MKQEMAITHDERGVDNYRSVRAYECVSARDGATLCQQFELQSPA